MAKGSIKGKSDGQGYQGANTKTSIPATVSEMRNGPSITRSQKGSRPASVSKMRAGPTVTRSLKGDIKAPPAMGSKRIGAVADKYAAAIGPSNKGMVPGGRGIMALNNVRLRPTTNAPKATLNATMAAPIKARVKPATAKATTSKAAKDVVRTTTNMKPSPTGGRGLGVTTGTRTGTSATRMGTGGKTSMSASQRAQQNAFNKGGVAGPSRSGGGGGKTSSGSAGRSTGGGNTGRGDVGAGRRGGR